MISIFKKDKPNVYLGELYVAPRTGIKKIDEWGLFESAQLEENVRKAFEGMIALEKLTVATHLKQTDIAIDFAIPSYQGGMLGGVHLGSIPLPFFWRPKVKICARIYNATKGETLFTTQATSSMPWLSFFRKQMSPGNIFRLKPGYDMNDMLPLMYQACIHVIQKTKRKAKL